jgi:hypothetical protein
MREANQNDYPSSVDEGNRRPSPIRLDQNDVACHGCHDSDREYHERVPAYDYKRTRWGSLKPWRLWADERRHEIGAA